MKSYLASRCFVFACLVTMSPQIHGSESLSTACPRCVQKTCHLTVSTKTEETECFEVECKDICIPPVTFPWQCSPKNCGRVRTVNVLITEKQEQQVCEYKWDVRTICAGCRETLHATGSEQVISEHVVCDAAPVLLPAPSPQTAPGWRESLFSIPLLRR